MKITGFVSHSDHLVIATTKGSIKILPVTSHIVRVIYTREEDFSSRNSLMLIKREQIPVEWRVDETGDYLTVLTADIRLFIAKETCAFTWYDTTGRFLAKEPSQGGKILSPVPVMKTLFNENKDVTIIQGVDGIKTLAEDLPKVKDRMAWSAKLAFEWQDDEALYGLGSHEEGILNLRGHTRFLYQQNMKAVVPMMVSTNGYGILIDCYSQMIFRDDVYGSYLWMDVVDELDYYFIAGQNFDGIISQYRDLTGQAPLFPKWAFGYVQSKERYQTQEELIATAKEFRSRQIPMDGLVLDWKSWVGDLWGQKTLDPERFPNAVEMMAQLHALNVHLMVSIWPHMRPGGENYQEMLERGFLLGNKSTYDAFNKEARDLYWKQANDGLFSQGIDAWWCDCSEPFEADWNGEVKPEPEERLVINTNEAKKYIDPAFISAYSLLHSQGIYENQRKVTQEKRVVNLTRSSYAGQHRYATITWSGDVAANWETLKRQIPEGLNFSASGEPYWTIDIGAFFVKRKEELWFWNGDYEDGCEDLGYRELFVRWFQYGAFLPMFRAHGTDTPREIWRFGEPGTMFYDALLKSIQLRYRLMPYIYSLAGQVTLDGYTMMRPLAFDFNNDKNVRDIPDQYMFGPALMVNPVTSAMYYATGSEPLQNERKSRIVYLPDGPDWYDFWTGEKKQGSQILKAAAPIDILPLYVKAGSIIPMWPIKQYVADQPDSAIELRIYPGADGAFTIYEDEGDNYDYEQGRYVQTKITWDDNARAITFQKTEGKFNGQTAQTRYKVVLVSTDKGMGLAESDTFAQEILISNVEQPVVVRLSL